MICRVNVPRRVKVSVPAVYEIFWANGNVETVESASPLDVTNYTDAASVLGSNGTIDASGMSSPVIIGGSNVSLVGGSDADTLFYTGGNVTIDYVAGDYLSIQSGIVQGDFSVSGGKTHVQMCYHDGSPVGTLTFNGVDETTPVTTFNDCFDAYKNNYYTEYGIFNKANPKSATAVIMTSRRGDFGVQKDADGNPSNWFDSNPVSLQSGEYFANIASITTALDNSTVIGNAIGSSYSAISINGGGYYNFVVGELSSTGERIYFSGGGGLIADFGIDASRDGADKSYARSVAQANSSTHHGYNRFDVGTYFANIDYLYLKGDVTGVYYDRTVTDNASRKIGTVTVLVTYTDLNGDEQVIFLPHVKKKATTTNSDTPSKRVWNNHNQAVATLNIWHDNNATSQLTGTALTAKYKEIADFPAELQPRAAELYRRYKNSPFYSPPENRSGQGSAIETLPHWLTAEE